MAALLCPCEKKHKIWGEFWWVGDKHEWQFFDDLPTSATYTEQVTHCPSCGRELKQRSLTQAGQKA
jgi:hypothetical protein